MIGLWLENREISFRDDLLIPVPGKGEALVDILYAGVCSTDLEMAKGYHPFAGIPGHEFVGVVIEDSTESGLLGKRVVGEINITCDLCDACRNGRSTHCENRSVIGIMNRDGAFAEKITLPAKNLFPVPDNVTDENAVFVEPIAAALEILQQIQVQPENKVLVIGAGRMGQIIARILSLTGCKLQVVVRNQNASDLLQIAGIRTSNAEEIKSNNWDIVVEATGNPDGFELAVEFVRPRGIIILKSTYKGKIQADLSKVVVDEISLIGSRCGPFKPALRLLENKLIDPHPLISSVFDLENGLSAVQNAAQPGVIKVLIKNQYAE